MAEAHLCPRCDGEREVPDRRSGQMRSCPTCRGRGVVWSDGTEEAAAPPESGDALDLTFRP